MFWRCIFIKFCYHPCSHFFYDLLLILLIAITQDYFRIFYQNNTWTFLITAYYCCLLKKFFNWYLIFNVFSIHKHKHNISCIHLEKKPFILDRYRFCCILHQISRISKKDNSVKHLTFALLNFYYLIKLVKLKLLRLKFIKNTLF